MGTTRVLTWPASTTAMPPSPCSDPKSSPRCNHHPYLGSEPQATTVMYIFHKTTRRSTLAELDLDQHTTTATMAGERMVTTQIRPNAPRQTPDSESPSGSTQ